MGGKQSKPDEKVNQKPPLIGNDLNNQRDIAESEDHSKPRSSQIQQSQSFDQQGSSQSPTKRQPVQKSSSYLNSQSQINSQSKVQQESPSKKSINSRKGQKKKASIIQQLSSSSQESNISTTKNKINSSILKPPSIQQLSQTNFPNQGTIDLICRVEDTRYFPASNTFKTLKSIQVEFKSRLFWIFDNLDPNTLLDFYLQDVNISQVQAPQNTKKVMINVSQNGDYKSFNSKTKFPKFDNTCGFKRPSSKEIADIEVQLKMIWNMIRKGDLLQDQTWDINDDFHVVAFQKKQTQQTLLERCKNIKMVNSVKSNLLNVTKWEINSDEQQTAENQKKSSNSLPPSLSIMQNTSSYNRYMMLDYETIPLVSVGSILQTVILGTRDNLKCDCYLKRFYIQPKWIPNLKPEEKIKMENIKQQVLDQNKEEIWNFRNKIKQSMEKINIFPS